MLRFNTYAHRCRMLGKTPDEIRRRMREEARKYHRDACRRCVSKMLHRAAWAAVPR